jgi:hypothetical protein
LWNPDDLSTRIAADHAHQFCHKAVPVSHHRYFFSTPEDFLIFTDTLHHAQASQMIPPGFLLQDEDWEDGYYSTVKVIQSGCHGLHNISIKLSYTPWQSRALQWNPLYLLIQMQL